MDFKKGDLVCWHFNPRMIGIHVGFKGKDNKVLWLAGEGTNWPVGFAYNYQDDELCLVAKKE